MVRSYIQARCQIVGLDALRGDVGNAGDGLAFHAGIVRTVEDTTVDVSGLYAGGPGELTIAVRVPQVLGLTQRILCAIIGGEVYTVNSAGVLTQIAVYQIHLIVAPSGVGGNGGFHVGGGSRLTLDFGECIAAIRVGQLCIDSRGFL